MKTVLITGITGFIGRSLAPALRAKGVNVVGVVRNPSEADLASGVIRGDILDKKFVNELINKVEPDVVFHLAANRSRVGGLADFRDCIEDNLIGTLNLAAACVGKPFLEKFVEIGTCEEYGRSAGPFHEGMRESPVNGYSFSKTATTHLLQTLHRAHYLPSVVLRPSLAYGPSQPTDMFLPALILALFAGEPFAMSAGMQTRDYVFIDDLMEAVVLAATVAGCEGKVFNICGGVPMLLKEVALMVAKKIGGNAEKLLEFGKKTYRHGEIMEYVASYKEAESALGWRPRTTLDAGLGITVEHYRKLLNKTNRDKDV
ncbi:MAG: NAD(P)-dependent oxidoreductase [Nitrospinae bacterium]|nr:NAD(P)-dependent oxidoreductase [Nitrospinota bacterium]